MKNFRPKRYLVGIAINAVVAVQVMVAQTGPATGGTGVSQLDSAVAKIITMATSATARAIAFLGLVAVAIVLIVNKDSEGAKKKGIAWLAGLLVYLAASSIVNLFST